MSVASRLLHLLAVTMLTCALPIAAAKDEPSALEHQRAQFLLAYEAVMHVPGDAWRKLASGLETYPLYPYLEFAALQRHPGELKRAQVDAYLAAWPGTLPAALLREAFLGELARRQDWKTFLAFYDSTTHGRELRCAALQARVALGQTLDFASDIEPLWLSTSALPSSCDAVLHWASEHAQLTPERVWQRIDLVARATHPELVQALTPLLDAGERLAAERIAAALTDPAAALKQAPTWPDAAHAREAVALAFERLARRDYDGASAAWTALGTRFHFDTEQRGRILRALALHGATSYAPEALARLAALPAEFADDLTREWRVRAALAKADFGATLSALDALSDTQKADARWRYLHARMQAKLGSEQAAIGEFDALAREANFYGFLAADWLKQPYAICQTELHTSTASEAALQPLARAFEFFALGRLAEARREWDFAQSALDGEQRRAALDVAAKLGWYDRAVYALNQGEDMRLYELRFPLARRAQIERDAHAAGIEPAFAYAIVRAESAWTTDAHSHADAYGLMQLLPRTAAQLAKAAKVDYSGAHELFDPELNITLGTRYLGNMTTRYDGSPWLASAAYNAGTDPVDRWMQARETLDPDLFIETIPYHETRDYVSRVLAFTVIYDWRLHGDALPLSARLPRIGQAYTPREDAERKPAICPTAAATTAALTAPAPTPSAGARSN